MIDIHTHILPTLDDGSQTIDDSILMAKMAYDNGVDTLIATPHYNLEGMNDNNYYIDIIEKFRAFELVLKKEQIPLRILLGMEIYATEEVPGLLRKNKIISLNQSRYLLLEFGFRRDLLLMDFVINEVIGQGYIPIIAHPERYPYIQKNLNILYNLIDKGCFIQLNKGSILGRFGRNAKCTAIHLLEHNLVSFIASDAHSPIYRTTDLSGIYQIISSKFSKEYADILMIDNPKCVIENKVLDRQFVVQA